VRHPPGNLEKRPFCGVEQGLKKKRRDLRFVAREKRAQRKTEQSNSGELAFPRPFVYNHQKKYVGKRKLPGGNPMF